jgi:hypothetical protein
MRKLLLLAAGLLALTISTATRAEVQVRIQMGFPAVLPPLVQVQPGVRVVQDFHEEVFFIGGYYYAQRDGNWYRSRDHRGTWRYVQRDRLPKALVSHEPGRYRHWQHDERRVWPDVKQAKGQARHWKQSDRREMRPPQEEHQKKGNGHDGDRHGHDGQ